MLITLLFALAAPGPVVVAPADPTVLFQGEGGAIKFDPTCRDYTLDTVASDPACAARVANREVAPAMAIAVRTLGSSPQRVGDALALLQKALANSDHPATHYMLGSVLAGAEQIQPDYPLAVQHLEVAARRGNPAAADLLATLILAGKGTPRDVPRAIVLYETAAANGFPNSAVTLGMLYLAGRQVPKDKKLGQAWLDAAAAVDAPRATQMAALAKGDDKINNYQLMPSSDPTKVRTVRYGTFDNPEIPPNFGFDEDFQVVRYAPYDDQATLARLEGRVADLPTPYLYELAHRLAAKDAKRSLTTYLLARVRMTYDAMRCSDPTAMEALRAWDLFVASDIRFLFKQSPSREVIDAALLQEGKLPAATQPWWVCRSGMAEMAAAIKGNAGALKLKPESEWPQLRAAARATLLR